VKVLSLFDGISCARVALDRAGIPVEKYYASELDKYAIQVASNNYPDIVHLGDVRNVTAEAVGEIDLLIGGSPCQDLSIAKKDRKGLEGDKSGLFWEYVRLWKELKPKYFILENVASMPNRDRQIITDVFEVEPIMIDAALVSAQRRRRYFWTNIKGVAQPEDRGILLRDILLSEYDEKLVVKSEKFIKRLFTDSFNMRKSYSNKDGDKSITLLAKSYEKWRGQFVSTQVGIIGSGGQGQRVYGTDGKAITLSAMGGGQGAKTGLYEVSEGSSFDYYNNKEVPNGKAKVLGTNPQCQTAVAGQLVKQNSQIRKLDPVECERLQGLPDGYTAGISDTQRYKCIGNAFNVDVVAHILRAIENPEDVPQVYQINLFAS